jgi:hypothetical protein
MESTTSAVRTAANLQTAAFALCSIPATHEALTRKRLGHDAADLYAIFTRLALLFTVFLPADG